MLSVPHTRRRARLVKPKRVLLREAVSDRRLAAATASADESNVAKSIWERGEIVAGMDAAQRGQRGEIVDRAPPSESTVRRTRKPKHAGRLDLRERGLRCVCASPSLGFSFGAQASAASVTKRAASFPVETACGGRGREAP